MPIPAEPTGRPAATLRRSIDLLKVFRLEQQDPDRFYEAFADDSLRQLEGYAHVDGRTVLDVGGGPGYFARAFAAAGARYVGVELEAPADLPPDSAQLRGSGTALPIRTGGVDVVYCSNVLEHVREPVRLADELVRVTRPGGVVYLSYTLWWGPWGGHETSPWHYLGGKRARRRYARVHGHEPKNRYGESLFAARLAPMVAWARATRTSRWWT